MLLEFGQGLSERAYTIKPFAGRLHHVGRQGPMPKGVEMENPKPWLDTDNETVAIVARILVTATVKTEFPVGCESTVTGACAIGIEAGPHGRPLPGNLRTGRGPCDKPKRMRQSLDTAKTLAQGPTGTVPVLKRGRRIRDPWPIVEGKKVKGTAGAELDLPDLEKAAAAGVLTLVACDLGRHHAGVLSEPWTKTQPQRDCSQSRLKTNEITLGDEGLLEHKTNIAERVLVQSGDHSLAAARMLGAIQRLIGAAGQA